MCVDMNACVSSNRSCSQLPHDLFSVEKEGGLGEGQEVVLRIKIKIESAT